MASLCAWVDESMRIRGAEVPIHFLGASIGSSEPAEAPVLLRQLAPRGNKLHWRDLGANGKARAAALLPQLGLRHVVVSVAPLVPAKQERARGLSFERLLWELAQREVARVVVESRSPSQDRKDLKRVDGLRSRAVIPRDMRVEWVPGIEDPMLWAPDLVLGALGDAYVDRVDAPPALAEQVTRIDIKLA